MKFRKLKPSEIECRVQQIKNTGASLLLYKDARCDMRILDEEYGLMKWQREHREIKGNIYCGVSLWSDVTKQWVTKWDAGAESYTEKVKGEASDSFKRACFNWGIGRELYTSPFIWVRPKKNGEKSDWIDTGKKDKYNNPIYKTNTKFSVNDIEYDNEAISYLEIIDQDGTVRFNHGTPHSITVEQLSEIQSYELSDEQEKRWERYFKVVELKLISKKQAEFLIDKERGKLK